MEKELPSGAKVVIIGGGVAGCSSAYHLAKFGWKDTILLERDQLTSGTTWHAAGLVSQLGPSAAVTKIRKYTTDLYKELEKKTGFSAGLKLNGALSIATTKGRWQELQRQATTAQLFDVYVEVLNIDQIKKIYPIINEKDILGGIFMPGDGQADPIGVTNLLAKAAKKLGVKIFEKSPVEKILVKNGRVSGVKVNDQIDCVITEIDKEKRRVAVSHRLTLENPYHLLEKKHPVGSEVEGIISSVNEYAIYLKIDNLDINAFLHYNDLTYAHNGEEELKKYKKGDKLKVKVLEIKVDQQKVRAGLKQTQIDPFSWFKDKKIKDRITVKVISSDNKGLIVKPEGCEIDFTIRKSQIAINNADARPSRFVGGERIDVAISELDKEKRKVGLSIKLLEELQNKEAVSKFSSTLSGKNLPFSSLSEKLKKKKRKKNKLNWLL